MLPNFIVIGAPKCGTTTLCHLLAQHPEVFMCTPKEPAFFSREEIYQKGLAWYESLFEPGRDKKLRGEGTTGYTGSLSDVVASSRIAQHLPDARLIYCVRHPVRRIESIWMDYASYGAFGSRQGGTVRIFRDFCRSVRANPAFVDTSCYWARLSVYRDRFPDRQIHVVFLEDLEAQPKTVLSGCFRFLGGDPGLEIPDAERRLNVSSKKSVPTPLGVLLRCLPNSNPARAVRRFLTSVVPAAVGKPLSRPSWDADLRDRVVDKLRDDTKAFLSYCGRPPDFWDLGD